MSTQLAQDLKLGGRISLRRRATDDLRPEQIAQTARYIADRARAAHAMLRPNRLHLAMSTPAAFAVLLGYHMTALQSDIVNYEEDGKVYSEALTIRRNAT